MTFLSFHQRNNASARPVKPFLYSSVPPFLYILQQILSNLFPSLSSLRPSPLLLPPVFYLLSTPLPSIIRLPYPAAVRRFPAGTLRVLYEGFLLLLFIWPGFSSSRGSVALYPGRHFDPSYLRVAVFLLLSLCGACCSPSLILASLLKSPLLRWCF